MKRRDFLKLTGRAVAAIFAPVAAIKALVPDSTLTPSITMEVNRVDAPEIGSYQILLTFQNGRFK